jgi:DUF4097 and DUF4098 domain-containing protein YvlB
MRHLVVAVSVCALIGLCLAPVAAAEQKETERVSKTVPIAPGGLLTLKTFSGRVTITAADRADVAIEAVRRATRERLDHIKLDIQSDGSRVTIDANKRDERWEERDNNVVETDFDIQVPRQVDVRVKSFSSSVSVTGTEGKMDVETFSGRLTLTDVAGPIDAKTFSGEIELDAERSGDAPSIRAETFSGDIRASVAPSARASVELSTFSGHLDSDMPMTFRSQSKRNIRAALGAEGATNVLRFKTFSGDVRLGK